MTSGYSTQTMEPITCGQDKVLLYRYLNVSLEAIDVRIFINPESLKNIKIFTKDEIVIWEERFKTPDKNYQTLGEALRDLDLDYYKIYSNFKYENITDYLDEIGTKYEIRNKYDIPIKVSKNYNEIKEI